MRRILPLVAALLFLTGCASAAPPLATATEPAAPPAKSAAPEVATENQVASVLAKYNAGWRETMDGAVKCRVLWTMEPGSMTGSSCWLSEQTLTTTSELVISDLGELAIPPSMTSLATSTTTVLQGIVDLKAKTVCGSGVADPLDTPACTHVLGSLNFFYSMLEGELDAWGPYM